MSDRVPVDSAAAMGRSLGLAVKEPVVLGKGLNLVVHLAPSPVVARVALRTIRVRGIEPSTDSLGNVAVVPNGHRWIDWEESWRGPVAWDLASLEHRRRVFGELREPIGEALAAYGPFDDAAVAAYGDLVTVWAAAWGVLASTETGLLGDGTRRRLAWLAARQ